MNASSSVRLPCNRYAKGYQIPLLQRLLLPLARSCYYWEMRYAPIHLLHAGYQHGISMFHKLMHDQYRLGDLQSAKSHLDGLRVLLRLYFQRNIKMSPALKRAIYW